MADVYAVLCRPADPRNVGGALRAVVNHSLAGLRVVSNEPLDLDQVNAYSSGALPFARLEEFRSLEDAVADCRLVLGTSARTRDVRAPRIVPAAALRAEIGDISPCAIVFGTERTGLIREEMDRCDALVVVPASEVFPSLNLSHAVAVIGYELNRHIDGSPFTQSTPTAKPQSPQSTAAQRDAFFDHVLAVCEEIGYPPGRSSAHLVRRIRKVLLRANPCPGELNLLAGIFSELRRLGRLARDKKETR